MKISKADAKRMVDAYLKKFIEYDQMPLDELIELQKSGAIKGTYNEVLIAMIKLKQNATQKED